MISSTVLDTERTDEMSAKSGTGKSIKELCYITHVDNVPSILRHGILSHELIQSRGIKYTPIYDEEIVSNRRTITAPNGKSLWSFANLYFQPRNPMLYRVTREKRLEDIAVIAVRRDILNRKDIFVANGNAASSNTQIQQVSPGIIDTIAGQIDKVWWEDVDGKRRIMAEALVPEEIPPDFIHAIYVSSHEAAAKVREALLDSRIPVIPRQDTFFQPTLKIDLTKHLSVLEGDMFFSGLQTLTISVNCVGIMGKGLASRAKYLFPDVYVYYQDLCRKRKMKLGSPYIYKREGSFDYQLADEPSTLAEVNRKTWFLLFPTKNHWRERADLPNIEKGIRWVASNYDKMGLESLAVPALGCGQGGLEWKEVGPLLCKYLRDLTIDVWIYLPAEKKVSREYLSKEFLLGKG